MCGENSTNSDKAASILGSPPRVRGKQMMNEFIGTLGRITPACAGKTIVGKNCKILNWDHPRVCGENGLLLKMAAAMSGSPPRVRGKRSTSTISIRTRRITPACAGKTSSYKDNKLSYWDHPRVCGENSNDSRVYGAVSGSPPRVRGKPPFIRVNLLCPGITPACAGKTRERSHAVAGAEDHPRVCGENRRNNQCRPSPQGSPPRVRGKPRDRLHRAIRCRITPACAGKTYTAYTPEGKA